MVYMARLAERRGVLGDGRALSFVQEAALMVLMGNDAYIAAEQAKALSGEEEEVTVEHFDDAAYEGSEVDYVPRNDLSRSEIMNIMARINTTMGGQPS